MENTLPYLLYASIFLTCLLGILLGILAISFLKLVRRYFLLQEEYERTTSQGREKVQKALEDVIRKVGDFGESMGKDLLQELKSLTKTEEAKYQSSLEEGRKELEKTYLEISKYLKRKAEDEAESFRVETQKALSATLEEYKKGVEEYKLASYKRINDSIYKLIAQTSRNVIGKSLNAEEHEELVIKSLEEAKKHNVL